MRSELRWALLVLGLLFVGALAWWERRRPRQARALSLERAPRHEPREASAAPPSGEVPLILPQIRARESLLSRELPIAEAEVELPPVLAPAPLEDSADGPPAPVRASAAASPDGAPPLAATPPLRGPITHEGLPELPPAPAPLVEWPPDPQRRIVALRLVAPLPERFAGRSVRQALAAEGFVLGRFAIFHKADEAQRAVLSAASLTRPGTFDRETMDSQHFGGLSLFAVLPGPKPPPVAFDELVVTARSLNERLHGELQDEQGSPLTPARIALLRERISGAAS